MSIIDNRDMLNSKGFQGSWSVVAGWTASLLMIAAGSSGALAEDIGIESPSQPRTSNVRTNNRRPPAPRRTVPRPIQDESTMAAPTRPATRPAARPVARPAARRGQEQAVNLDALTTPSRPAEPARTATSASYASGGMSPHGGTTSGVLPNLKFYFDFVLRSWKGNTGESDFGFDSYHQRLMVEFTPTPELMFQGELLDKKYFETDYMLTPRLQVRWGKIWIPFDDMSPHSMFGGRINTTDFRQTGESAFLPDIWADLGIGFKYLLSDSLNFQSELHFYVVNGFRQAASGSPIQAEQNAATPYPSFEGITGVAGDNNNAKALGARWHAVMGRRFGLGASVYKDTYTDKAYSSQEGKKALGILIAGVDAQLRPTTTTEIRAGYVTMKADLDPDLSNKASFTRGGTYVELGQRFGTEDRWKFLIRAGASQNDNRVVDVSDKTIVGTTILKNFGSVEAQVNYYRDLHQVPQKTAYNYGEFRLVTAF